MEKNEKTLGMTCHLLGFLLFTAIPLGNVIGPLVLWLMKKDESSFVDQCGKNALNFQISMTIYLLISGALVLIFIGFFLIVALLIIEIVFIIKAAMAANNGELYDYPLTIKLIK